MTNTDDLDTLVGSAIRRATNQLQQLPRAYDRVWQHLLADTPGPAAPNGETRRSGKPGSKPPAGNDNEARAAAARCVHGIGDAHQRLAEYEWPDREPWNPEILNQPADDLTVQLPNPVELVAPIRHLRGMLTAMEQHRGWEPADAHTVRAACRHVQQAVNAIRHVGLWERPRPTRECNVCHVPTVYATGRCKPCHEYRRRTGGERPWHLWTA